MDAYTLEILKAKASALRALLDALAQSTAATQESIDFITIWTEAVESMIPAEPQAIPDSEVTRWRDRQGDVWVPNSGGGWRAETEWDQPDVALSALSALSRAWGPLTRADQS